VTNSVISFSQNNVTLNIGQTGTVTLYGSSSGSYYVNSNSNSSVASASISGNTISLYGNSSGSSNISVCSSGATCSTLYVNVSGNSSSSTVSFSQNNITLNVGQSLAVTLYGNPNNSYYISNPNSSIVSASVSGSTVNLYGSTYGSSNILVCSTGTSSCGNLYVNVP
jgi:archaellin